MDENPRKAHIDIRSVVPKSRGPKDGSPIELELTDGHGKVSRTKHTRIEAIQVPYGDLQAVVPIEEALAGISTLRSRAAYRHVKAMYGDHIGDIVEDTYDIACLTDMVWGKKNLAHLSDDLVQAAENEMAKAVGTANLYREHPQVWPVHVANMIRSSIMISKMHPTMISELPSWRAWNKMMKGMGKLGKDPDKPKEATTGSIRAALGLSGNDGVQQNVNQAIRYASGGWNRNHAQKAGMYVKKLLTRPPVLPPPPQMGKRSATQGKSQDFKQNAKLHGVEIPRGSQEPEAEFTGHGDVHDLAGPIIMEIIEPPLTVPTDAKGRGYRSARSGIRIRPHRIVRAVTNCSSAGLFSRKKQFDIGGAVLIDRSGSMRVSDLQLRNLCNTAPGTTVAYYSGYGSPKVAGRYYDPYDPEGPRVASFKNGEIGPWGFLVVYAEQGYRAAELPNVRDHGSNDVDLWALEWLLEQPGPRYYVTDCDVCGGPCEQWTKAHQILDRALDLGEVTVIQSVDEAQKIFQGLRKGHA
jgi:hypothetical protein